MSAAPDPALLPQPSGFLHERMELLHGGSAVELVSASRAGCCGGERRGDEESKELRVGEVQTDTRSHAEGKCQDSGLVRAEIPRQEGKIVPKGDARFADDAFVARGRLIRVDVGLQLVQKNEGLDGSSLSGSYR